MDFLSKLGYCIVVGCWLFINFSIRALILVEVYVIALLLPLQHHLGTTSGPGTVYDPWHRAIFLASVPVLNAVFGFAFMKMRGDADKREQKFVSWGDALIGCALANMLLLMSFGYGWPESVIAQPAACVFAAFVIASVNTGINWLFCHTPLSYPPANE
jgi:hypothetical protein